MTVVFVLLLGLLCLPLTHAGSDSPEVRYEAENLGLPNWAGMDYAPQISPDGRFLVFQSDRPGAREGRNLWFTMNRNAGRRLERPVWTVPLPLYLPMDAKASDTMRIVGGTHVLKDPPGTFSVNTDGFEGMSSIVYRDGKPAELFFTSLRDAQTERDGYSRLNLYHSRFVADRWTPPVHLNAINSHFDDRMPAARFIRSATDGGPVLELLFVSDRPGGYGGSDLWRAVRDRTGRWSRPTNLGPRINTRYHELSPMMNPTGGMLFFASNRPGGFGHYDLYAARFQAGVVQEPKNLGRPFNSDRDDEYISFTADGLWAYFASDRRQDGASGLFDIYRTRVPGWLRDPVSILFTGLILDGRTRLPLGVEATIKIAFERKTLVETSRVVRKPPTQETVNFSVPLSSGRSYKVEVSAPGFSPQGLVLDYSGTIPDSRIDRRVIILQPLRERPPVKEEVDRTLEGVIVDEAGKGLAGASAELTVGTGRPTRYQADAAGRFGFRVPKGAAFRITGRADGFEESTVDFQESPKLERAVVRLKKKGAVSGDPCRDNMQECLDRIRIYFATDRADLRPRQARKLTTVVRIMRLNPDVRVDVQGYADRRASFQYNKELSIRRAKAVQAALAKLGIPPERVQVTGKSFLQPVCRERTRRCMARNRRVEFKRLPNGGR